MQVSAAAKLPATTTVYVGRQPIYGRDEGLVGYELLYRSGKSNVADFSDGDQASLAVMLAALVEIGLPALTSGRTAFINLTRNGVLCEFPRLFPREKVVFEILEDVCCDEDVMLALRRMAADGHTFALDDFIESERNLRLLEFVRILKLDIQSMEASEFARHAHKYSSFHLIAEKVETQEHHQRCLDLNFAGYQGFWFSRPSILTCSLPAVSRSTVLSLLLLLKGRAIADVSAAANVLATDPALLLRVLRAIPEPPAGGVGTLGETIHAVGSERLAAMCTLLALMPGDDEPAPEAEGVLARARLCEILGGITSRTEAAEALFAGLLLAVAPAQGERRVDFLKALPLAESARAALTRYEGTVGAIVRAVLSFESGVVQAAQVPGIERLMDDARNRARRARDLLLT